jgi:hypothetical protein
MKMLNVFSALLVFALISTGFAANKAVEDPLSGKWKVSITSPRGQEEMAFNLKLNGTNVTVVSAEHKEFGFCKEGAKGTFENGKLHLTMTFSSFGDLVEFIFDGTLASDGTMSGLENFNPLGSDPNAPKKEEKKQQPATSNANAPRKEGAGSIPKDLKWTAVKL